MLTGFQRSFSNLNGPEPTYSEIGSFAEVSAIRFGIMNGTLELGFASDSSTRPYGDFRCMLKVFSSTAFISETKDSSFCPIESLAPQRLIEAMQSSAVTGWPSCHSSPSRRVKV